MNSVSDFKSGDAVRYVPLHAEGKLNHPDCESGIVSSTNSKYVFVKFQKQIERFSGDMDAVTAQSCDPEDLIFESDILAEDGK